MDILALEETYPGIVDALLGADEATLDREWGLQPAQVRRLRRAIEPVLAPWLAGLVPERPGPPRHPALARHPGIERVIGTQGDRQVAAQFGLSRERVRQLRALAGIPRPSRPPPPAPKLPRRSYDESVPSLVRWQDPGWKGPRSGWRYVAKIRARYPGVIEALPTLSTKEIERRFGLNKKGVRYLRAFLGIPSPDLPP